MFNNSSNPSSVPTLQSNTSAGTVISAPATLSINAQSGSFLNSLATPAHNVELIGVPLTNEDPRTKSDRCTKVYIGRIPSSISDYFMEQLFLECGSISSWKRPVDSTGKSMGFGFVEFQTVEGMLRCLRLMNGLLLLGKKIIVRIDPQTEFFIKEWSDLKRSEWERLRWDSIT